MSPGVPRDARFSQVSAGDPSFHSPPETYSERPAWGKVAIGGLQSAEKAQVLKGLELAPRLGGPTGFSTSL